LGIILYKVVDRFTDKLVNKIENSFDEKMSDPEQNVTQLYCHCGTKLDQYADHYHCKRCLDE